MSTPPNPSREEQYRRLLFATSVGAVVLCPLVMALPPRKLDVYTVALIAGGATGGNQLVREYTGRSVVERVRDAARRPEGFRDAEQRRRAALCDVPESLGGRETAGEESARPRGVLEALWMGEEKAGWKTDRDAREKRALEDGRGYGGLIVDQIREVWSGGRGKSERAEEVDVEGKIKREEDR